MIQAFQLMSWEESQQRWWGLPDGTMWDQDAVLLSATEFLSQDQLAGAGLTQVTRTVAKAKGQGWQ